MSQPAKAAASMNLSRSNSLEDSLPQPAPGSSHHSRAPSLERAFRDSVSLLSTSRNPTAKSISIPSPADQKGDQRLGPSLEAGSEATLTPSTGSRPKGLHGHIDGLSPTSRSQTVTPPSVSQRMLGDDLDGGFQAMAEPKRTAEDVIAGPTSTDEECNGREIDSSSSPQPPPAVGISPGGAAGGAEDLEPGNANRLEITSSQVNFVTFDRILKIFKHRLLKTFCRLQKHLKEN